MATPPRTRSFFYLVKTNPPTRDEFRSYFDEVKVPPNASPHEIDVLKGVSMWETEIQARALQRRMRERRAYVAEVAIPEGVRVSRQGRSEGHHNVYASADELLGWVVGVIPPQ